MAQRVLVTGAGGFVGRAVVRRLLASGYEVAALVNRRPLDPAPGLSVYTGSLDSPALKPAAHGCAATIHLVGIICENPKRGQTFERVHIEGTRRVLDVSREAGVTRYVHMSALGTRPDAVARYHQTKWAAEELVRHQAPRAIPPAIPWTIFRPSLIHGPEGEFTQMQLKWATRWPFMPCFGRGFLGRAGTARLQPVYVEDVASAFVSALTEPRAIGQTFDLVGADVLDWRELHRTFARVVTGKTKPVLPVPLWYARLLTKVVPAGLLPFNADQVAMAAEDNIGDAGPWQMITGKPLGGYAATLRPLDLGRTP